MCSLYCILAYLLGSYVHLLSFLTDCSQR
jgi:hypothetical protein